MKKANKWINSVFIIVLVVGIIMPSVGVNASSSWGRDDKGWYYYTDSSFYKGQWAEIEGCWYYFTDNGYMDYSEYREGCWLNSDGSWNTLYSNGMWKSNDKGWWYEDSGWYPVNQWLWIDGYCYYFNSSGYMENNCFRDGYYLTGSGAWDFVESNGKWSFDGTGWRFDTISYHARNIGLWIDGNYYWFDEYGYYDEQITNQKKQFENNRKSSSSEMNNSGDEQFSGENGNEQNIDQEVNEGSFSDNTENKNSAETISKYKYEVIPLMEPFNSYYYLKTDNPDPNSFRFVDKDTVYAENGEIVLNKKSYADVVYEDIETRRVKDGYIFKGSYVDGGIIMLQAQNIVRSYNNYNLTTGEVTKEYIYEYEDTDVTVTLPRLVDNIDYLIEMFGDNSISFFENLSGIQKGLNEICLYGGVSVLGELKKSDSYYGLSTSVYPDQKFYIQSPYYRSDNKDMLTSDLYPFRYTSIGFPEMMWSIAERINPSVEIRWDSNIHYYINITYEGTTKRYGGAGSKGGNQILDNQVLYYYSFDKSMNDAANVITLDNIKSRILVYDEMSVPDERDQDEILTWGKISQKVGKEGCYIKLCIMTSGIINNFVPGYTYVYDNGYRLDTVNDYNSVETFSNAWFDGRYFNKYEFIYNGITLEETIERNIQNGDKVPDLIFKDFHCPIPDDSDKYYVYFGTSGYGGHVWSFNNKQISKDMGYNPETGNWEGFMRFSYDTDTKSWKAKEFVDYNTHKVDFSKGINRGQLTNTYTDKSFNDLLEITMEEALEMKIDKNTNTNPMEYYIYDRKSAPGTYEKSDD